MHSFSLAEKYPPSQPCGCGLCQTYCIRPGWWTVEKAAKAMDNGYADRMMLEMSPDVTFGVLAPAFKGCEKNFALQEFARAGCTFLKDQRCELHGTGFQPLECRFCHHERKGQGQACHQDLEADWKTLAGQSLVGRWIKMTRLMEQYK